MPVARNLKKDVRKEDPIVVHGKKYRYLCSVDSMEAAERRMKLLKKQGFNVRNVYTGFSEVSIYVLPHGTKKDNLGPVPPLNPQDIGYLEVAERFPVQMLEQKGSIFTLWKKGLLEGIYGEKFSSSEYQPFFLTLSPLGGKALKLSRKRKGLQL